MSAPGGEDGAGAEKRAVAEEVEGGESAQKKARTSEGKEGLADDGLNKVFKSTRSNKAKAAVIDAAYAEAFGPLRLNELNTNTGKTKTRNHVNPLSSKFQTPVTPPKWEDVYADTSRPLWVDVGCAQGRFGIQMALHEKWGLCNHLGLEIREPHVTRANAWAREKGLKNALYVACNANVSLEGLLASYPGPVSHVAVQFPDPMFKRKHHKRRVVKADFLEMLGRRLAQGTVLFFQSDVEEAAAQMRDRADQCKYFDRQGAYSPRDPILAVELCASGDDDSFWTPDGKRARPPAGAAEDAQASAADYGDWLEGPNPIGVVTEREVQNTALGEPIYRCLFVRNAVAYEESA